MGRDRSWVYGAVRFLDVVQFGGALAGKVSVSPTMKGWLYGFVVMSGGEFCR